MKMGEKEGGGEKAHLRNVTEVVRIVCVCFSISFPFEQAKAEPPECTFKELVLLLQNFFSSPSFIAIFCSFLFKRSGQQVQVKPT